MLQRSVFNNKNGEKNVWSFKNSKLSCFYTRYLLHLLHWMVYNVGTDLISSIALKRSALPPPARRLNKYNTLILHDCPYTGPLLKIHHSLLTNSQSDRQTLPGINNTLILRTLYKRMGNTKKPTPGVRGNASVGNLNFLNVRNACFWHSGRFLVDSLHY